MTGSNCQLWLCARSAKFTIIGESPCPPSSSMFTHDGCSVCTWKGRGERSALTVQWSVAHARRNLRRRKLSLKRGPHGRFVNVALTNLGGDFGGYTSVCRACRPRFCLHSPPSLLPFYPVVPSVGPITTPAFAARHGPRQMGPAGKGGAKWTPRERSLQWC